MKNLQKRLLADRRVGRPIMFKSQPPQEVEVEEVKEEIDPEELDRQLYYTLRFY